MNSWLQDMGGALELESQACVAAQSLDTLEFTVPVDGWNCAHIGQQTHLDSAF